MYVAAVFGRRASTATRRRAAHVADRVADAFARRVADRLAATGGPVANRPEGTEVAPAPPPDRDGVDNAHLELLMGFLLKPDSNCIDVGANEGRFLHAMTSRAPRGSHIAWEPLPDQAERLRRAYPGVEVRQAALSDSAGEASFVVVPDDPAYSGLRERSYPADYVTERITVRLERLDDVVPDDYVPALIKVDVEGAELQVFEGARETLARHRPIVAFEHGMGAADRYGTRPEQIWDLFCGDLGMRLFDMDAEGPLSRERFREVFDAGRRWNFVAVP